ncbi:hypothetical protein GQR58_024844 [Nymphon striatum]|nr:hypothetical protein GQR58_024844 [Nymphon striatum]
MANTLTRKTEDRLLLIELCIAMYIIRNIFIISVSYCYKHDLKQASVITDTRHNSHILHRIAHVLRRLKPWHYWKRWTMVWIYIWVFPRDTELSDGDSDLSDDEVIGSSIRLGRGLLEAEEEITGPENETPCTENRTGRCPLNKVGNKEMHKRDS